MEKDKNITEVQFLMNEKNEDLFAFFQKESFKGTHEKDVLRMSYSHIGQHSDCHIDYAKESRKATEEEYKELKQELESLGYNLKVI